MSKSVQTVLLLITLVLIWGIGWPIISIGLQDCPPLWYSTIRFIISIVVVFAVFGVARQLVIPDKRDLPLIFSIGFVQIGLFVLFITLGLQHVAPGRSAIIAYISPIIVTPIVVIFFGEELTLNKIIGLLFGITGIALLFSPWELNWHDKNMLMGNGFLVLSAIAWSIAMIHIRYAKWHRPTHELFPWQLLLGLFPSLILALILDPHPHINITKSFVGSVLYTGILASGLCYWMSTVITRRLPVSTTSLALLAVPVVGLLSSSIIVGEKLELSIIISLLAIMMGLVFLILPSSRRGTSKSTIRQ